MLWFLVNIFSFQILMDTNTSIAPLVSIITGYYNREDMVDESIESLLSQTYTNIEIIAFDDCSTDNTYLRLKRFEIDERFRLIRHDSNKGFVRGVIDAIRISSGEFIAIHGSGDYSFPTRIEKQVSTLLSNTDISLVGCENELYSRGQHIGKTNWFPAGNFYEDIRKSNIKISHGDVMYRRKLYDEVGGYRTFFRYAQDRDLWCRMSLKSNYYIIPEVLYRRQRHIEGSVSGTPVTRIKQVFYSQMAVSCLEMRKKLGYDYVDIFGDEAFALLNGSKMISNTLARYFFQLVKFGKYDDVHLVSDVLKTQKVTLMSFIVSLISLGVIPLSLIKYLINKREKMKNRSQ